jgi:hypothetical protein
MVRFRYVSVNTLHKGGNKDRSNDDDDNNNNINSAHVECESKSDTSNNRSKWNHPKVIRTIPEQHTGRNYKNSHIGHCIRTAEGAITKYKTHFTGEITLHATHICTYRTAGTLYTLETWFVSGI